MSSLPLRAGSVAAYSLSFCLAALCGAGCISTDPNHCKNKGGDQFCGGATPLCDVCASSIDNGGCAAEVRADCRFGAAAATSGTQPTSTASPQNDGPALDTTAATGSGSSSSSTATTGGTEDSTGAVPVCQDTETCAPSAPDGWIGPLVLLEWDAREPAVECEGDYPDLRADLFTDLEAPAANCECDCGPATGMSCDGSVDVSNYAPADAVCGGAPVMTWTVGAACNEAITGGTGFWAGVDQPIVTNPGNCKAMSLAEVTPAAFASRARLCGRPELGARCSADARCVPSPPGAVCISREGAQTCPREYPERTFYYEGVDDSRSCAPCMCGAPNGTCSGAELTTFRLPACAVSAASPSTTIGADLMCGTLGSFLGARYTPGTHTATECTPSVPVAQGSAEPTDVSTVCCAR